MRDGFDKDVYAISRVSENATVAQIKSAHRNLAKIVHPDRHPAASERLVRPRLCPEEVG